MVFIQLTEDASDFVGEYHQSAEKTEPMPDLNLAMARKLTIQIFEGTYSLLPKSSPLIFHP